MVYALVDLAKTMHGENTDSDSQPPKIGIARQLYELAEDDDIDVEELIADARDGGPDD